MHSSRSSSSATATGGATPITAIHPDIILSQVLNRLDGQTLASTSCASSQLLSLCSDDNLWRHICNATWPSTTSSAVASAISSFPSGHRSFFSDSFPSINHAAAFTKKTNHKQTSDAFALSDSSSSTCERLISAVDIFYDDELVYSKVLDTQTTSSWFLSSPFRLDLLDQKETVRIPSKIDDATSSDTEESTDISEIETHLRISWIVIDPDRKRAVNVASREALEARRHWLTNDVQFRYATAMASPVGSGDPVQCSVSVTCGAAHVREVILQVADVEGKALSGRDSLVILQGAMEGQRCKYDGRVERDSYEMFLTTRLQVMERKQRWEKNIDLVCVVTGIFIFFAILVIFS